MGTQNRILVGMPTGLVAERVDSSGNPMPTASVTGAGGSLSPGKAGDVVGIPFGPLVRAKIPPSAPVRYGTFVDGLGLLVDSDGSTGVTEMMSTVGSLMPGQAGSFMTSGMCIVRCADVPDISARMSVAYLGGYDQTKPYPAGSDDLCAICVTGFRDETEEHEGETEMRYVELKAGDNVLTADILRQPCVKAQFVDAYSSGGGVVSVSSRNPSYTGTAALATVQLNGDHGYAATEPVVLYPGDIVSVSGSGVSADGYSVRLVIGS